MKIPNSEGFIKGMEADFSLAWARVTKKLIFERIRQEAERQRNEAVGK